MRRQSSRPASAKAPIESTCCLNVLAYEQTVKTVPMDGFYITAIDSENALAFYHLEKSCSFQIHNVDFLI
jgi:hypothetical protein